MFKALQAKFTQHEYLRRMLVETKERKLVERSPYDSYWGDGGDGSGKNRLGELLMKLRGDLTPKPHPRAPSPPPQIHHRPPSPPVPVNDQLQRDAPTHTSPPPPLQQDQQQTKWRKPNFSPDPDKGDGLAPQPTQCQTPLQQNTATTVSSPLPATQQYSTVVAGTTSSKFNDPATPHTATVTNTQLTEFSNQLPTMQHQPNQQSATLPPTMPTTQASGAPITSVQQQNSNGGALPQLAVITGPDGNLMQEYNVTQLTRSPLPSYPAANAPQPAMPARVQTTNPPKLPQSEDDPTPMETDD